MMVIVIMEYDEDQLDDYGDEQDVDVDADNLKSYVVDVVKMMMLMLVVVVLLITTNMYR